MPLSVHPQHDPWPGPQPCTEVTLLACVAVHVLLEECVQCKMAAEKGRNSGLCRTGLPIGTCGA
eukprot:COSAG05_NODE_3209_length_2241_cov_40.737628_3_plen_64_part_00